MKSLLEALKEEDRLRILIKEIDKDNEATKDFKSQHLNNIQKQNKNGIRSKNGD